MFTYASILTRSQSLPTLAECSDVYWSRLCFNSGHEIKLGVTEALINQVSLQVVNNSCVKLCHMKPEILCTNTLITYCSQNWFRRDKNDCW